MYEKFYGFSEKPFHIVPNPRFLYLTGKHQNALTSLEYGIAEGGGFILLTGDVGTGKTTLVRHILNEIEADIDTAVLFNTNVSADQLLDLILQELELVPEANNKAKNLDTLFQFLIKRYGEGRRVLLIIDEAQNLSTKGLEEVRMLSNLQSDDQMLLSIMLVGQPELKAKLHQPGLAQFAQRISVSYHLTGLDLEETGHYISSRLTKVGGSPDIFTLDAVHLIHTATDGIPRSINQLCDSALVYGFADELPEIGVEVIGQILEDNGGMGLFPVPSSQAGVPSSPPAVMDEDDLPVPAADFAGGEFLERFHAMENNVNQLQMRVEWQIAELEKRAEGFKDELVRKLNKLLAIERKRSDRLLSAYSRLNEKFWALKWQHDKEGGELPDEMPRLDISEEDIE